MNRLTNHDPDLAEYGPAPCPPPDGVWKAAEYLASGEYMKHVREGRRPPDYGRLMADYAEKI